MKKILLVVLLPLILLSCDLISAKKGKDSWKNIRLWYGWEHLKYTKNSKLEMYNCQVVCPQCSTKKIRSVGIIKDLYDSSYQEYRAWSFCQECRIFLIVRSIKKLFLTYCYQDIKPKIAYDSESSFLRDNKHELGTLAGIAIRAKLSAEEIAKAKEKLYQIGLATTKRNTKRKRIIETSVVIFLSSIAVLILLYKKFYKRIFPMIRESVILFLFLEFVQLSNPLRTWEEEVLYYFGGGLLFVLKLSMKSKDGEFVAKTYFFSYVLALAAQLLSIYLWAPWNFNTHNITSIVIISFVWYVFFSLLA